MSARPTPVFAANWKMFKGPRDAEAFGAAFCRLYAPRDDRRVIVFPPAVSVESFARSVSARPDLEVGVQDVHQDADGAHTGAISASMAAQAGAAWSLAGHSERRREFGDDDARVAQNTRRILATGLSPLVCIGETLEEREADRLTEVLRRQVQAVLASVDPADRTRLTWAYEPVWAIGTGRTASPADAAEAHAIARRAIQDVCGGGAADRAAILYGGSVKSSNIGELMGAPGVDGVLVGGASLEPEGFAAICSCPLGGR